VPYSAKSAPGRGTNFDGCLCSDARDSFPFTMPIGGIEKINFRYGAAARIFCSRDEDLALI
jgi:hypothetical protein